MKKWGLLSLISFFVLAVFALFALGSGETTEPERVETESPVADEAVEDEPADTAEIYTIGDTVKMGDLIFTVNSARWDEGSDYIHPEAGEKWLVFDCSVENIGEDSDVISSMMMFVLYDEENYSRDVEFFADTKGSLDGELGSGRTMRGEIAFAVEDWQNKWEFIFQPNIFGFGQAIYQVSIDDID